ncbi:hypothetical protein NGF19_22955 [Streptomyces sp. RY43-2]|uniref:Bifunctional protein n=1 Tax=Streptomyces macrolidinus TaxID=2952607 RepID=A0ABT0ZJ44_9ACTN|nr:hypothetical protein [Streptomyces macrolidinus]MCN9243613.1 hypothetical protein [Streptomyces macrolidinus]
MRHRPFFRWVVTLGVVLVAWSAALYALTPGYPDAQQIDLTVIDEKPDGTCTVRWTDPFDGNGRRREAAYHCDPDRSQLLKAPYYDEENGYGWETGFVIAEGPDKGELEPSSLDGDTEDAGDNPYALSDALGVIGLLLTAIGLVGGNVRATARVYGVRPRSVARARKLYEAADLVTRDYARVVAVVQEAWTAVRREQIDTELARTPLTRLRWKGAGRRAARDVEAAGVRTVGDVLDAGVLGLGHRGVERPTAERVFAAARSVLKDIEATAPVRIDPDDHGPQTIALLTGLRVLIEAGPEARRAATGGKVLAGKLEPLLAAAEPAAGYRSMLRAGPELRAVSRAAVIELRALLAEAEQREARQRFAQASVDLLRMPDDMAAGLAARTDFESRTSQYYALLATLVTEDGTSVVRS